MRQPTTTSTSLPLVTIIPESDVLVAHHTHYVLSKSIDVVPWSQLLLDVGVANYHNVYLVYRHLSSPVPVLVFVLHVQLLLIFFFLNDPAPPEISPFPLHDALPI